MQCDPHVASILEIEEPKFSVVICMGAMDVDYDFIDLRTKYDRIIFYCCEASNPDWWPKLDAIKDAVDLIVNVDGNDAYKGAFTTLAIYGRNAYRVEKSFGSRPMPAGFCGGWDPNGPTLRSQLLRHFDREKVRLGAYPLFVNYPFIENPGTYQLYADFLKNTKFVVNASGSAGDKSHHVKGRVLEAGMAGCCLLEDNKSPIGNWFSEDCYFKYNEPWDCEMLIRELLDSPEAERRALNLAKEVREKYNPEKLWQQIFERCG